MALEFLSSTLTEEEYIAKRAAKSQDTAASVRSMLTNVKLFCQYEGKIDFYVIINELKKESETNRNVGKTLVFMQKFVTWLHAEHPDIMMPANQFRDLKPFQPKRVSSILNYIGQLRKYLKSVGGIPISSEDVSDFLEYPADGEQEEAEPLTHDELRRIIDNQKSFRRKMLYRITKDTCSRIRAMCLLLRENVNIEVRPIEITFPKHIMKNKKRTVVKYVTEENEKDFLMFLKDYPNPRDQLFGTNVNGKIAATTEQKIWNNYVKKLGYTDTYRHSGRLKKNIHSIKAFTETAAEEAVNDFYANAYGDHENYLSQYIRWNYEKKIKKFRAMENLINLYTKVKFVNNTELELENKKLRKMLEENAINQKKIEYYEPLLEKLLAEEKELKEKLEKDKEQKEKSNRDSSTNN